MTIAFILCVFGFIISAFRFGCSALNYMESKGGKDYCDDELWLGEADIHWSALVTAIGFAVAAYFLSFWAYPAVCC